jgi:HPt (histidine-containing phosphotransfer) domain-containing protein
MDTQPLIDPVCLEKLSKYGPPGFLAKLVTMFEQNALKQVDLLRQAMEQGDGGQVAFAAHALKSSAGQVGATEVHRLLTLMEMLGKEGRLDDVKAELSHLDEVMQPSLEGLRKLAGI